MEPALLVKRSATISIAERLRCRAFLDGGRTLADREPDPVFEPTEAAIRKDRGVYLTGEV